jgi:hypothetical protein
MTAGETTIDIIVTHATGLTSVSTFNVTVSAEEEKITAADGYSSDNFGYALAMSGDYAVVGAKYDDDRGSNSGAIYIYHRKASGWYQHSKIIPDDGTSSDYFGEAVAMNNDYMVVGAPYDDNSYTDQGSAYIYKRNGNNWVLETKIYANDRDQSDYFGRSVSISGNWIIIGAAYDDNSYSEQGSAYIFKTDGTQVAKLYASDYASGDYFGVAVSISGDYAIIGAYYDDDYYSNSGSAYIFYYNGTSWTQQAKLTASDGYSSDYFGQSVFISDDYAIIGAPNNDANGSNSGAAYIFQRDGTSWNQMAKLTAGDALTSDNFGCSVYLKAGYAIVGAKNNDHMATNAGAAYIFKQTGSQWIQLKTLNASDAYASDYFGHSVAIENGYALVGAYADDDNGSDSGSAYFYPFITKARLSSIDDIRISKQTINDPIPITMVDTNGGNFTISAISSNLSLVSNENISISSSVSNMYTGVALADNPIYLSLNILPNIGIYGSTTISLMVTDANGLTDIQHVAYDFPFPEQKITAIEGAANDYFGKAVGISGHYAIVGADYDDEASTDSGSAYIFTYGESGWVQSEKIVPLDGTTSDYFGSGVDIDGNRAIVGAYYDDDKGSNSGSAYIFTRNGSNWIQSAKLTAQNGASSDYFGYFSVALSGDYAIVGALYDDFSYTDQGSVFIFKYNGSSWVQDIRLEADDRYSSDYFGCSVAIDGDSIIVGAYADDDMGSDSGSAYIFVKDGDTWSQQAKLTASDGASSDHFGYKVSISGDYAIVGARYDDDNGSNSGSAYIFKRDGSTWSESAKLTPTDGEASDYFGYQVAISGDYAIVGAYYDDDNGSNSGAIYIYKRNGSDWPLILKQTGADTSADDRLGYALAMSDTHVIVGAYLDDDTGSNSGSAYIFELNTQPMLMELENISFTQTTDAQSIHFTIVDCDGSDITITAISSNPSIVSDSDLDIAGLGTHSIVSGTTAGASTCLSLTITPTPIEMGDATITLIVSNADGLTRLETFTVSVQAEEEKITALDGYGSDHFGYAVSMSDNFAVVGSRYDDDKGSNSGAIYIYQRSASGWNQISKVVPDDGAANDYFGSSVAMDHDYFIVGADYDDHSYTDQGSAYIYKRYGDNWHLESKLYANDRAASDYFGRFGGYFG